MVNNKIYAVAIIAAIVLSSGIGWSLGTKSNSNDAQEKSIITTGSASAQGLFSDEKPKDIITLKIPVTTTSFHGGYMVTADRYGFFEEEGIKPEYILLPPGAGPQFAALKAGQIDMLSGHPDTFTNAVKGGLKVKAVINFGKGNPDFPHDTAWVQKDSPIKEPKDVIGKKVGGIVTASWDLSCMSFFWSNYFKKNGIPRDQVIPVNILPTQQEQALAQGLIDIMTVHPPQTGVIERSGKYRRLWSSWETVPGNVLDKEAADIWMTGFTQEYIAKNPDVVRRYVRAIVKAMAYQVDNRAQYTEWIQKLNGWDPIVYEGSDHHYTSTGLVTDRALKLWINWQVDGGILKPGEIKPEDLYTNEFNPYSKYKVNDPAKNPTYWDNLPREYLYVPVKNTSTPSK